MKNKVKEQRKLNGYTQKELAVRINVSRQTIHAIESGKYIPSTVIALKLSRELNIPVDEMFFLEEKDR